MYWCFDPVPYSSVMSPLMVIFYCTLSLGSKQLLAFFIVVWKYIMHSILLLWLKFYYSVFKFITCVKMHHQCLLFTKNENFCTINIILCIIIIYLNVFASSFVFSIYSYTLDVSSCCRIFWVCIVVKCSDSCGGCSCTTDVWACATVFTFATLLPTPGPKPFVPVLCIF